MKKIDLNKYSQFVETVTSKESNDTKCFIENIHAIEKQATDQNLVLNFSLLFTAAMGLSSESGEFSEIVKKMAFQGKPLTEENHWHLVRELGDICWYWINACRALGYDPNDVIEENVRKLEARYPGGTFDPYYSENRKDGDL